MTWDREEMRSGVLTVDGGRGFVIAPPPPRFIGLRGPFIITAAHCLPHLPPAASFVSSEERTYANLIGVLHGEPAVWAECLFVDPVADLAALGSPDGQELYAEARAYEDLVEGVAPFLVADLPAPTRSVRELPRPVIREVYDPEAEEPVFRPHGVGRSKYPTR